MCKLKDFLITVLIFLTFTSSIAPAGEVKTFVPAKPWQITINLNEFEPLDLLQAKTILGGSTKDGINITILVEQVKHGTTATDAREIWGQRYVSNYGIKETAQKIDVNDFAIIVYKWTKPDIPDFNEPEKKQTARKLFKEFYKNRWGYHGYVVKDDVAFDIHLSADMSKHTKKQMLDIIKSFRVEPSIELQEHKKLFESVIENISNREKEKLLRDFIGQYPNNADVSFLLGEYYFALRQLKQAKSAYLKALQNHRTQPFINPILLLHCYEELGVCCGMLGEYDQSKQYLESSYKFAKKTEVPMAIASSAYNLACLYAETNDPNNSIKYLTEAVKLNPESKEEAKQDPSFANIKENQRFKDLIYK